MTAHLLHGWARDAGVTTFPGVPTFGFLAGVAERTCDPIVHESLRAWRDLRGNYQPSEGVLANGAAEPALPVDKA